MDQNSIENICRVCLNVQDTLFSLYRKRHGTSPYEKLASRTKLSIQLDDAGPPSICSQCLIDLDTTVSFLDKCERSNRLLGERTTLKNNEESSDYKSELLELEPEVKPRQTESARPESTEAHSPEVKQTRQMESAQPESIEARLKDVAEECCGECGARRRCAHWAPPRARACPYCQKTFNKKYNYQIHIKRHLGENSFSCGVCGAGGLSRWRAARHCRARARRACPAPGCGRTFTTATNLHTHIRKHTGERPFECDNCGKSFISKNILNNHMRIHTGVKPYMCQICGAQFATNKLAAHLAAHAPAGAEPRAARRPHACARAGCTRAFRTPRDLREHARAHSAERQHACALCAARYKYKQSLNYHVRRAHPGHKKSNIRPNTDTISTLT